MFGSYNFKIKAETVWALLAIAFGAAATAIAGMDPSIQGNTLAAIGVVGSAIARAVIAGALTMGLFGKPQE